MDAALCGAVFEKAAKAVFIGSEAGARSMNFSPEEKKGEKQGEICQSVMPDGVYMLRHSPHLC